MVYKTLLIGALFWWSALGLMATPEVVEESADWKLALNAYDHGQYKDAIRIWEGLRSKVSLGEQGNLLYNLGNAYFRDHQVGKAHGALLAAKRLLPRDPEVRDNLKFVAGTAKDKLQAHSDAESFLFWQNWVSDREVQIAEVLFGLMSIVALALWAVKRGDRALKVAIWGMLISGFCECLVEVPSQLHLNRWWVVVPERIEVRSGPIDSARVLFELHSGAPVRELSHEDGWIRVVLSDGKQGWLKTNEVARYLP